MIILFIHEGFPGQFKYLASILAQDEMNLVLYLTADAEIPTEAGINKIVYKPEEIPKNTNSLIYNFEKKLAHSKAVAKMLELIKSKDIIPDVIFGHSGCMFVKDIFPDVPFIKYSEWVDTNDFPAIKFSGENINDDYKEQLILSSAHDFCELEQADGAISPLEWQKAQYPKSLQQKITVIHDGVNTNICKPNPDATFEFEGKTYTTDDEIVTYATRGMEPVRGFPQFMKAAEILLKKRPNVTIFVGGLDKVCYGKPLKNDTWKQKMLRELDLDMSRIHFIGGQDYEDYIKLLQTTSAHVYATYPFVLSWSLIESLSCGTPLICSSTEPVLEVIKDNYNGLLYDFYNINMMVEKVEFALDNKDKMKEIRTNARNTAIEKFNLADKLAEQIYYIQNIIKNSKA